MGLLSDIPIIGGLVNGLEGNPDAIKAAYDKAIAASQANSSRIVDFLGQRRGQALGFYGPMQHMFGRAYGTEGIQAPMTPQANQGLYASMYGGKR